MRLYLIRHGQTAWNADGRAQGHSDVPLDARGVAQAERIAEYLGGIGIRHVYSSDLIRCVSTAKPLTERLGLELKVRQELRERTFGELEGKHYTELRVWFQAESRAQGLSEFELRPEGGESVRDVWKRTEKVSREIERSGEHSVVFTHGGTVSVLMARLMRGTLETTRSLR
ncbi:MAG: histidine phosphatase family protein, partial [Fimbriimonadaceae bacterium]|nr:histidine phosphatase family protein [Fimbriimonadaceae bacterium]